MDRPRRGGARAFALLLLASACAPSAPPSSAASAPVIETRAQSSAAPAPAPAPERTEEDPGGQELFRKNGVDGAFVLLDEQQGTLSIVNPEIASKGYVPASTFKIPNTLIGLTTGVIPDEHFSLPWDGKKRSVDAWNRDHDLASAMKFSVVWFYQEIARRIGAPRMQQHVDAFAYGNRQVSSPIDRFWLDGALRITPREQVDFLRRLKAGALPVRPEHVALVLRLITLEESKDLVLRGKTGLEVQDDRTIGWLVGFVDKGGASYVYATLVLAPASEARRIIPLRRELTQQLLARRGVLPAR
jgi:beta-lactamase class D